MLNVKGETINSADLSQEYKRVPEELDKKPSPTIIRSMSKERNAGFTDAISHHASFFRASDVAEPDYESSENRADIKNANALYSMRERAAVVIHTLIAAVSIYAMSLLNPKQEHMELKIPLAGHASDLMPIQSPIQEIMLRNNCEICEGRTAEAAPFFKEDNRVKIHITIPVENGVALSAEEAFEMILIEAIRQMGASEHPPLEFKVKIDGEKAFSDAELQAIVDQVFEKVMEARGYGPTA